MTINNKKTEVIFFGNKAHLKKLDNKTVRYLDTPLKRKDKVKYLGVLFDEKMQWKYQIKNITQKASMKLGKIKAIASFLTPHTKKLLVNALVMPYFHYCSPAWSNAAPFRLSKINKKVVDASVFLGREDNYSIYNMLLIKIYHYLLLKLLIILLQITYALKFKWLKTVILITPEGLADDNMTQNEIGVS